MWMVVEAREHMEVKLEDDVCVEEPNAEDMVMEDSCGKGGRRASRRGKSVLKCIYHSKYILV